MSGVLGEFLEIILPPDPSGVVAWAEKNIYLSPRVSPNLPGEYSTLMCPYVREPLEAFADLGVTDIVLCWGSQTFKTTTVMVGVAFRIDQRPAPILWVVPNETLGRSFSQTRWQPMLMDSKVMLGHLPEDSDEFKLLEMHFDRCTMNFVGSNSPAQLASRPCAILVADEVDKFAQASAREAGALQLAENRTKSFAGPLRVKMSTPTVPEGEIWKQFQAGDQRYFYVPCPHCGDAFRFEFSRDTLVWSPEARGEDGRWNERLVRQSAHYKCPHCGGKIHDVDKPEMLRRGAWRATNGAAGEGVRSYHLNSFYSPSVTFGEMAVQFLRGENLFGLQDFWNGWLALPWEEQAAAIGDADVLALRDAGYRLRTVPHEPVLLSLAADPGERLTHWTVEARIATGESWMVDYGTVLTIEDLLDLPERLVYRVPGTELELSPKVGLVDSGDFTERVYAMCARSGGVWWPSKGSSAAFGTWGQSEVKGHPGLILYTYVDYTAKVSLYLDSIKQRKPPPYHLPQDVGPDFVAGLSGQRLIEARTQRGVTKFWKPIAGDHYGDCSKLHRVIWWVLRQNVGASDVGEG